MIALNENQRYTNLTLAKSNVGIGVLDYVWRTTAISAVFLCSNSLLQWVGYTWCSNAHWVYLRTSSTPTCIVLPATIGVVVVGSKKSTVGDNMSSQSIVAPATPVPFSFENHIIRTVNKNGEVWFVARDVCSVLELTNPTVALQSLDDDEVTKFNLGGKSGEANIINESGLYALILRSRKPEAKRFRKWVTQEVLPAIRKTGSYSTTSVKSELVTKRFLVYFGIDNQLLMKQIPSDAIIIRQEDLVDYLRNSCTSTPFLFKIMEACNEEVIDRLENLKQRIAG